MNNNDLRAYYENLFAPYPDVVDLPSFRKMMGGISEKFSRKLLISKEVRSFKVPARKHEAYYIPKDCVLDYVASDAYQNRKHRLKSCI